MSDLATYQKLLNECRLKQDRLVQSNHDLPASYVNERLSSLYIDDRQLQALIAELKGK